MTETEESSVFKFSEFKIRHTGKLRFLSLVLFCLLVFSVFKNISYPLLWADEIMTAMGAERVLEYGYPKVHDGKNVFYDLNHPDKKLGINEKDDAYVGGAGWGQYYYGIIGYKLAETTSDIYFKTALFRATFAFAGLLGLCLFCYFISSFYPDKFSASAFVSLFLFLELKSVPLALLLREVRYYSLVILFTSLIAGLYIRFRFYKPFNTTVFIGAISLILWLTFITFSPVYFIAVITLGVSETIIGVYNYLKSNLLTSIKNAVPVFLSLLISLLLVYPLLSYFKTFEISSAMNKDSGFDFTMYWKHLFYISNFFNKFDLIWLAIGLKVFLIVLAKKLLTTNTSLFKVSNFLSLFFIVSYFFIPLIPGQLYSRYIIFMQPFLSAVLILDFSILLYHFSANRTKLLNTIIIFLIVPSFALPIMYSISKNLQNIKGHIYEMSHVYKGPLDYTIPFIKTTFPVTDTLVIATNYEESSYMYYLKAKVIVGFVGNNLEADAKENPHIISYRKAWGNLYDLIAGYRNSKSYSVKSFPVEDILGNNFPELNAGIPFSHKFKTLTPPSPDNATLLYIRE